MKWTVFVALALIGLVAGDGAWKENREYKYKLVAKTFVTNPGDNRESGSIGYIDLRIRPQSSGVLLAQITRGGVAQANEEDSKDNDSSMSKPQAEDNSRLRDSLDESLRKPFKIHLYNGVIHGLSVYKDLTNHQINQLKYIVSQFQIDTKAKNTIKSDGSHLPNANANNAFYVTMEETASGECETIYDISPIADYVGKRESLPLPDLVGEGEVIQIMKHKNYSNCNQRTRYTRMQSSSHHSYILITGSLNNYTIQSVATTKKADGFKEYIYLTLESVNQINSNANINSNRDNSRMENLNHIPTLVYKDGLPNQLRGNDETESVNIPMARVPAMRSQNDNDVEEQWSKLWTGEYTKETICKVEFSAEWQPVGGSCYGAFCMGGKALCRHSFPGCKATDCHSSFIKHQDMCDRSFGDRLPIVKGTFADCSTGFSRARCCPRSYETKLSN